MDTVRSKFQKGESSQPAVYTQDDAGMGDYVYFVLCRPVYEDETSMNG